MQLISVPVDLAALFAIGAAFGVACALVYYAMIGRVNRYLSESEQILYVRTPLRSRLAKPFRIFQEHRRFYPTSLLPQVCVLFEVGALISLGIAILRLQAWLGH